MPTYEYQCTECGHTFDAVQSFSDDALTECPECGGKLKKLFGNVGIAFKGSGFYVNDSNRGSKSSSSTSSSSASNGSSSTASSNGSGSNGSDSSSGTDKGGSTTSTSSGTSSKD